MNKVDFNLQSTYDFLKKKYPRVDWEKDTDYDQEEIEASNIDYGSFKIVIYPDCWYITGDDDQFGFSATPRTVEDLIKDIESCSWKCGLSGLID